MLRWTHGLVSLQSGRLLMYCPASPAFCYLSLSRMSKNSAMWPVRAKCWSTARRGRDTRARPRGSHQKCCSTARRGLTREQWPSASTASPGPVPHSQCEQSRGGHFLLSAPRASLAEWKCFLSGRRCGPRVGPGPSRGSVPTLARKTRTLRPRADHRADQARCQKLWSAE